MLKDINGAYQFLLIPTARISGMEDPAILAAGRAELLGSGMAGALLCRRPSAAELPRDAVALAINSSAGRTQDQLHIHIDCVRKDVHDTLAANMDQITDSWEPFPEPLAGHYYRAIRIAGETLGKVNPFRELADSGVTDLGMHTLVLVGSILPNGEGGSCYWTITSICSPAIVPPASSCRITPVPSPANSMLLVRYQTGKPAASL